MSREHLTWSLSSLTTRTCPILRTPANSPAGRHAGPSFSKTLILPGKSSLVQSLPQPMPSPAEIRLTPFLTMLTLLLCLYWQLSMPLISPLPVTSSPLPQMTPLYFVPSITCLTTLPSSHIPPLMTGPLIMDICITRGVCMFCLLHAPLCYTPSIPSSRIT